MNRTKRIKGYEFGAFQLDTGNRHLLREGVPVSLTLKSYDLLTVLVESEGNVLPKEKLMDLVWPDHFVEEANLSHHIYLLRKALGDDRNGNSYIETIPRRGYRFVMEVRELPAAMAGMVEERLPRRPSSSEGSAVRLPANGTSSQESPAVLEPISPELPVQVESQRNRSARVAAVSWIANRLWLMSGLVVLATVVGYVLWNGVHSPPKASESRIVPFTTLPGQENQPAFSPDGSRVAFSWDGEKKDNFDIYVRVVGIESQIRLTVHPAQDTSPAWSPDGRFIAFQRNTSRHSGFYIVPALGGPERKVGAAFPARAHYRGRSLDWFPDGKSLAIVERGSEEHPFHISILSIETGEKRQVIFPAAGSVGVMGVGVSPDGQMVAFSQVNPSLRDWSRTHSDLYVVPSAGGQVRRLTFDDAWICGFGWYTNGQLLFSSSRSSSPGPNVAFGLWSIPLLGGSPQAVPVPFYLGFVPYNPSVSRSGNRLLFEQRDWAGLDIWKIPGPRVHRSTGKDSSSFAKLVASTWSDENPQFSPNGEKIAYSANKTGNHEIWLCNYDGQNPLQLTSFNSVPARNPRWSPDSSQLAFDCSGSIYVIKADGSALRRLTSEKTRATLPSWSNNGQTIYFGSDQHEDWQIWKIPIYGGIPIQVTRQGGVEAFESPDGKTLYFAKYRGLVWSFGLSSLWRMPVEGGEETKLVNQTSVGYWGITKDGLCYLDADGDLPFPIKFLNFATDKTERIGLIEEEPLWNMSSLAVSPDGLWILHTKRQQMERDLMLIENFH